MEMQIFAKWIEADGRFAFSDTHNGGFPIDRQYHAELFAGQSQGKLIVANETGYPVLSEPPAPTPAEIEAAKVASVQHHMDEAARAYRYDDIKTACTYADEPAVPKFQAEGQAFRAWRSMVWAKCYEILDEVNDGKRPIPSDEELIAELPELGL